MLDALAWVLNRELSWKDKLMKLIPKGNLISLVQGTQSVSLGTFLSWLKHFFLPKTTKRLNEFFIMWSKHRNFFGKTWFSRQSHCQAWNLTLCFCLKKVSRIMALRDVEAFTSALWFLIRSESAALSFTDCHASFPS